MNIYSKSQESVPLKMNTGSSHSFSSFTGVWLTVHTAKIIELQYEML